MMIDRLKKIKCFLLDMDGTFYLGGQLLPGALDLMWFIQANECDYLFLTNNSSKSAPLYAQKIKKMGFDVPINKILTSGEATIIYLKKHYPQKKTYLVGTLALEKEFSEAGIVLTMTDPQLVVLGFDTAINYKKIWKICDFVREGLPYIATHPDFNCPTESGFMPDAGSFMALIDASTGRKPDVIIGKPHKHIVEAVVEKTGYRLSEIAMIGDRLYTDIAIGKAGITTILALSGETKLEDLKNSPFHPDLIVRDLAELTDLLKK